MRYPSSRTHSACVAFRTGCWVSVVLAAAAVFPSGRAFAQAPLPADDAAMAIYFSFSEMSQTHLLAHALGMASINGAPKEEVIEHCDRAIARFEGISVPIFRKYLAEVERDKQAQEILEGIGELQQRALGEVLAVKAMAESGNGPAERLAFLDANSRYNELVQPVAAALLQGSSAGMTRKGAGQNAGGDASPNPKVFSDEEWSALVAGMKKRGLVRDSKGAGAYFGTFALLKYVFLGKKIPDPTPEQLFGLAKVLNVAFGEMKPAEIETTLRAMLQLAEETETEVATRESLLRMRD